MGITDERILTPLLKICYSFPIVIKGIPGFDLDSTGGPHPNAWHPGYFEAYFTYRYPTLEEYMKIKSEHPGFYFGKPNKMCYHGN